LENRLEYQWNGKSGYWAVSPDNLWPQESINTIETFSNAIIHQATNIQKEFLHLSGKNKNDTENKIQSNSMWKNLIQSVAKGAKSIIIDCLDIETTTYLPKALEGFVYIIGITRLEIPIFDGLHSEKKIGMERPKLIIKQVFNMTRGKERSSLLIQHIQDLLLDINLLLVFNQDFDIRILQSIQEQNDGVELFNMPIYDLARNYRSISKLEEKIQAYFPMLARNTDKTKLKEYYNLFKGHGKPHGIRRFEPLGRYNLADILTPLLIFLKESTKFNENKN
jgi:hypothetical protein